MAFLHPLRLCLGVCAGRWFSRRLACVEAPARTVCYRRERERERADVAATNLSCRSALVPGVSMAFDRLKYLWRIQLNKERQYMRMCLDGEPSCRDLWPCSWNTVDKSRGNSKHIIRFSRSSSMPTFTDAVLIMPCKLAPVLPVASKRQNTRTCRNFSKFTSISWMYIRSAGRSISAPLTLRSRALTMSWDLTREFVKMASFSHSLALKWFTASFKPILT